SNAGGDNADRPLRAALTQIQLGGRPARPPAATALSRREFLVRAGVGAAALFVSPAPLSGLVGEVLQPRPHADDSVVVRWNQAALQGVRASKLGPPMVARALAIVHTAAFDAWSAYDHRAIATRLGT